jgi:hypothetical protein
LSPERSRTDVATPALRPFPPAAGGAATRSFVVERDLRDIVIQNGSLSVTKFRSAEILRIASDGTITRRDALPAGESHPSGFLPGDGSAPPLPAVPHVAWRAIAGASTNIVAVHQMESRSSLSTKQSNGYDASGRPIVENYLSEVSDLGTTALITVFVDMVLPVDIARSADGAFVAVASAACYSLKKCRLLLRNRTCTGNSQWPSRSTRQMTCLCSRASPHL